MQLDGKDKGKLSRPELIKVPQHSPAPAPASSCTCVLTNSTSLKYDTLTCCASTARSDRACSKGSRSLRAWAMASPTPHADSAASASVTAI